jgi:type I restriction enzyme M protein
MEHDGFSLDDKRQRVRDNDIPHVLACWKGRNDPGFEQQRLERLGELQKEVEPLKEAVRDHQVAIHRLRFEEVMSSGSTDAETARIRAESELDELQARLRPLTAETNQLSRQFWVSRDVLAENRYDLSANRYRHREYDEAFFEEPAVTLKRLAELESLIQTDIDSIRRLIATT